MNNIRFSFPFFLTISLLFLLRIAFMFHANLLTEEAYYWNYSNHLAFSFLDHPPMVAFLIKLGTLIFGVTEWGVRSTTLLCCIMTGYFSFKLTSLIDKRARWHAIFLLSILPFFYIHSLIITPDIPLILCWSAALYYLYQAIVLDNAKSWYRAGIWIGLGLLSKYTIIMLGLSTIIYLIWDSDSRKWFLRREPYCCALLALILFLPVIYWNATHQWVSFLFQGSRRFHESFSFSFHELIALVLVYLTPTGILGAWILFSKHYPKKCISIKTKHFFQIYIIVPLLFLSFFSLFHSIRINWIGPIFLAIIPWLALQIVDNQEMMGVTFRKGWAITCSFILFIYSGLIYCILLDTPEKISHSFFEKIMSWDNFSWKIHTIAQQWEGKTNKTPILIPLDTYNIASELAFYQQKYLNQRQINTSYKIIGSHVFGLNSLMYKYWGTIDDVRGKHAILISQQTALFSYAQLEQQFISLSAIKPVHYYDKHGHKSITFYYKIVEMI